MPFSGFGGAPESFRALIKLGLMANAEECLANRGGSGPRRARTLIDETRGIEAGKSRVAGS